MITAYQCHQDGNILNVFHYKFPFEPCYHHIIKERVTYFDYCLFDYLITLIICHNISEKDSIFIVLSK